MIATRASALALAAILGVSAVAHAQTPPPPAGAPGSQMRMHHEMRAAARMKALHEALNIRPDQENAFQSFVASMRPEEHGARGEQGARPEGTPRPDMAAMTTPERLDAMARMMDERTARMRERFQRHATAVKAFYAALSPEQRRTFDALPNLMGRGMGMGMGGHRGMGKPGMGMDHPGEHE